MFHSLGSSSAMSIAFHVMFPYLISQLLEFFFRSIKIMFLFPEPGSRPFIFYQVDWSTIYYFISTVLWLLVKKIFFHFNREVCLTKRCCEITQNPNIKTKFKGKKRRKKRTSILIIFKVKHLLPTAEYTNLDYA